MNKPGADFAHIDGVTAMTDVTGFGLLGHLSEICQGSGLQATVWFDAVPKLDAVEEYITAGCVPGGTTRNFDSYGHLIAPMTDMQRSFAVRSTNLWWSAAGGAPRCGGSGTESGCAT